MAGKASPKVGAKRSRDEESDDADAKKSEAKVAKEEVPTVAVSYTHLTLPTKRIV